MKQILIVDDHEIICEGIATLVHRFIPGYEVIMLHDMRQTAETLQKHNFSLLILDINVPNGNPLGLVQQLKKEKNPLPVLMFSAFEEKTLAQSFFEAGAKGYIQKSEKPDTLVKAISTVLEGGTYMSENLHKLLLENSINYFFKAQHINNLSIKEVQLLTLLKNGKSMKQIAEEMEISLSGAYQYKKSSFSKLEINDETQIALALDQIL